MAHVAEECWTHAWEAAQKRLCRSLRKGVHTDDLKVWPSAVEITAFAKSFLPPCHTGGQAQQRRFTLAEIFRTVHQYAPVFDVFVQQQPFLAAIVWGTCRFVVQVAASGLELKERIASALLGIIPRVVEYPREVNLYADHPSIRRCVQELFSETIVFLVKSREYAGLDKVRRMCKAAFGNDFEQIIGKIQSCVGHLEQAFNSAAREAQAFEFAKQDSYRGASSTQLQRVEENTRLILITQQHPQQAGGQSPGHNCMANCMLCSETPLAATRYTESLGLEKFADWVSKGVLEGDYISAPEPNTCELIYQHPRWTDWVSQACPNTLLLTGASGAGKSVYAKSIASKAKAQRDRLVLTHFFCRSAGDRLSQANSFVLGILWQLCQETSVTQCEGLAPILRTLVPVINTHKQAHDTPFQRLWDLLLDLLHLAPAFLLVVDSLDECTADAPLLLQSLFDLGHQPRAQVIVTSRHQLGLHDGDHYASRICLDQELIEPDIACFVRQEIHRNPKFGKLQHEITDVVLQRSQGIFLHARLLIDDLKGAKNVRDQKLKMDVFGSKAADDYQRLFAEHSARLTAAERSRRDDILRLLIAAKIVLSVEQVSEALALDEVTQSIDRDGIDFESAEELTRLCQPLVMVSDNHHVVFINNSAQDFLLQHHLDQQESDLFLARKCLSILTRNTYRRWRLAASLLRRHLLAGTISETASDESREKSSKEASEDDPALYEYAVLHFQDHVVALRNPPEDVVAQLARFLLGVEFVVWSETVFDLRSQSGLGSQIAVYRQIYTWTQFLPPPIQAEIPIDEYFETAHVHLARLFEEQSQDTLLQFLPQIRNAEYFNAAGQSVHDWQKAYDNKKSIVAGFTQILGPESPVTLRFRTSLLQEYFWQQRFQEALDELLAVADLQRKVVGDDTGDYFMTLWLLGCAYHDLTRFAEALSTFVEAAHGVEQLLGVSSRLYLLVGLYQGHTLEQLFRYDEAMTLYKRVSDVLVPIVGESNGFVLMSRTAVGALQRKQGRYDQAEGNLLAGWGGREKLFSIHVNVCLDAAVQLALLYRDRGDGHKCLEVLDAVAGSAVYQQDFERRCQTQHIRQLVALDNGAYAEPKLALLLLLHEVSGANRNKNNRELLWVRHTLTDVMRRHGEDDEASTLYTDLVQPSEPNGDMLPDEPEPPIRLHLAEQALRLVRAGRQADAEDLLRRNGLRWVRDEDFWILGEGGPVTDTACIAPIRGQPLLDQPASVSVGPERLSS